METKVLKKQEAELVISWLTANNKVCAVTKVDTDGYVVAEHEESAEELVDLGDKDPLHAEEMKDESLSEEEQKELMEQGMEEKEALAAIDALSLKGITAAVIKVSPTKYIVKELA